MAAVPEGHSMWLRTWSVSSGSSLSGAGSRKCLLRSGQWRKFCRAQGEDEVHVCLLPQHTWDRTVQPSVRLTNHVRALFTLGAAKIFIYFYEKVL